MKPDLAVQDSALIVYGTQEDANKTIQHFLCQKSK